MINKLIQLMKAKPVLQKIPEQVLCTKKKNTEDTGKKHCNRRVDKQMKNMKKEKGRSIK